jgi:membrane protease YdiL (CAAX protease family)
MVAGTLAGSVLVQRGSAPQRLLSNLALAAAASALARLNGAGLEDQGMKARDMPRGVVLGSAIGVPAAAGIIGAAGLEGARSSYWESRITSAPGLRMAYEVLFRIPFGTALSEEVLFRGAMLGLFSRHRGRFRAVTVTSLVFGVWHIAPTLRRLQAMEQGAVHSKVVVVASIAGSVLLTSAAGVVFAWLRYRARSTVAPWLLHSAVNAAGFAGGWVGAQLRRSRECSEAGTAAQRS